MIHGSRATEKLLCSYVQFLNVIESENGRTHPESHIHTICNSACFCRRRCLRCSRDVLYVCAARVWRLRCEVFSMRARMLSSRPSNSKDEPVSELTSEELRELLMEWCLLCLKLSSEVDQMASRSALPLEFASLGDRFMLLEYPSSSDAK